MFTDRCPEAIGAAFSHLTGQDAGTHVVTMNIHLGSEDEILSVDAQE